MHLASQIVRSDKELTTFNRSVCAQYMSGTACAGRTNRTGLLKEPTHRLLWTVWMDTSRGCKSELYVVHLPAEDTNCTKADTTFKRRYKNYFISQCIFKQTTHKKSMYVHDFVYTS